MRKNEPAPKYEPYSDETIDSVLRKTTRNLAMLVGVFVALLIALHLLPGCAPGPVSASAADSPDTAHAGRVTGASVVTLLRHVSAETQLRMCMRAGPSLARCAPQYEPAGNAFAIKRPGGDEPEGGHVVRLLTAAHCLHDGATRGDVVRYLAPSGIGHDKARVVHVDGWHDVAELAPMGGDLHPLELGRVPAPGASVVAVSSLYGKHTQGALVAQMTADWFEVSLDVQLGWSGSPVLGPDGRVFALLSKCLASKTEPGGCMRGVAYVARVVP